MRQRNMPRVDAALRGTVATGERGRLRREVHIIGGADERVLGK
jgi:hypothetical protein